VSVSLPVPCGSQSTATSSTTYATTVTVNVPGSVLIVVVTGSSGSDTSTAVHDSQGNPYTLAASNTTNENVQCWTAPAIIPLTGGTDTITVTYATATTQQKNIICCYLQGAIFPVDLGANGNGSSGTASVTGGTPTYYSEMAFAVVQGANGSQPLTAPATTTGLPYTLMQSLQTGGQQITSVYYQLVPQPSAQTVSSTLNASHQWAMLFISVPVIDEAASPVVPQFIAGYGPQQSDMQSQWADPARFYQQRVMYRVSQTQAASTIGTGYGAIKFDTMLEDPWRAWNSGFFFVAPFDGWYQVTGTVWTAAPGTTNCALFLTISSSAAGNPTAGIGITVTNLPAAGGAGEIVWAVYLSANNTVALDAAVTGVSSVSTNINAGQQSTMEVIWISS
jgi:hypothetical protein